MNYQNVTAKGGFQKDLFNSIVPSELPTDIQFMPPGPRNICPMIDGKGTPLRIQVDEALAAKLNAQLQQMRQKAASGEGDVPFVDFNHEDAESAGEPMELYWGGNDPMKGGIRMKVKWSDAGVQALKGKNYRRFSPAWYVHKETKQPVGLAVNVGGLVNRAAFQTIQPIVAKDGSYQFSDEHPFISAARALAADERIPLSEAQLVLARTNYDLYSDFVNAPLRERRALAKEAIEQQEETFPEAVERLESEGVNFKEACRQVNASRPELYHNFLGQMRSTARPPQRAGIAQAAAAIEQQDKSFLEAVARLEAAGVDFKEACRRVEASRPDLYDDYLKEMRGVGRARGR